MRKFIVSVLVIGFSAFAHADDSIAELGKQVYMTVCVACHQPSGMGLPPVFPPLTKNEYVEGSGERLAAIVLKGIIGPINVNGQTFVNVMPPQEAMLTDEKIAAALTFVRSNFGNSFGPVSSDTVGRVRKALSSRSSSFSETDLKAWSDLSAN
jgi:nitrite reductase (NO-forming)